MPANHPPERHVRALAWLVAAIYPLAVLPFATVHGPARTAIGLCAALLGLGLILSPTWGRPPRITVLLALPALLGLALCTSALLPIDMARRATMQPGLVASLAQIPGFADTPLPLALHPRAALAACSFAASMLLLACGTALVGRHRRAVRRFTIVLVLTGLASVLTAIFHRLLGIDNILYFSEIPVNSIQPSFPPFISANHGGVVCALLVPPAIALLADRAKLVAGLGGVTAALLVLGTWLSGSRAAVLVLVFVLGVLGLQSGVTALRRGILGLSAVLTVLLATLGAAPLLRVVTRVLTPRDDSIVWGADLYGGRLETYATSLDLLRAAPWWGIGAGSFEDGFKLVKSQPYYRTMPHAHSDALQALAEHGIPAALMLFGAVALLLVTAMLAAQRGDPARRFPWFPHYLSAAIGLCLYSLVDFPLRTGAVAVLAALLGGLLAGMASHRHEAAAPWVRRVFQALALAVFSCTLLAGWIHVRHASSTTPWGDSARTVQRADALLAQAGEKPSAQTYHEAIAIYRLALTQRPLDQVALMKLARAEVYAGRHQDGLATLRALTHNYATFPFGWLLLARLQQTLGDTNGMFRAWHALLGLDPPSAAVGREWVAEALADLAAHPKLVAALIPDVPARLIDAGAVMRQAGQLQQAEAYYREAQALDPNQGEPLANFLFWAGRLEESLAVADAVPPRCPSLRTGALACLRLGRTAEAQRRLKAALEPCGAHDAVLLTALAETYLLQGESSAEPMLQRVLAEAPDYLPARRLYLDHLRSKRRWEQVLEQLRVLVEQGNARTAEVEEYHRLGGVEPVNER